ncbi:MAG: ribosomal-processing cysteine protease Prp [Lachnospiraceae bacterium]|nr:ribosomal-processing cysteine protease Prp [Lachnospiraceae bacterium]
MIRVNVYKSKDGKLRGFKCLGHAEYADPGEDIVCAAVSMLVINTVNSISKFLPDEYITVNTDQESGLIECYFEDEPSEQAILLMKSMLFGLESVEENYQGKYLRVEKY